VNNEINLLLNFCSFQFVRLSVFILDSVIISIVVFFVPKSNMANTGYCYGL